MEAVRWKAKTAPGKAGQGAGTSTPRGEEWGGGRTQPREFSPGPAMRIFLWCLCLFVPSSWQRVLQVTVLLTEGAGGRRENVPHSHWPPTLRSAPQPCCQPQLPVLRQAGGRSGSRSRKRRESPTRATKPSALTQCGADRDCSQQLLSHGHASWPCHGEETASVW